MNSQSISVIQVASELGLDKRHLFKILKRLGIETFLDRSIAAEHRGQAIAHVTIEDFEAIRHEVSARSLDTVETEAAETQYVAMETGVFYLIQLEPEHDTGRFKVGFAVSISERLRAHRCAAPFSVLVKTWPCRRVWERTAIDCVTMGCEQLHTEVFRTCNLSAVIARCDQFFSMMPQPPREDMNQFEVVS